MTKSSGPTSLNYEVTQGNIYGSIENIMKSYKKYDLSNVKVNVDLIIGKGNKNEIHYSGKGNFLKKGMEKEFIKENINISVGESKSQHGPSVKINLQQ